MKAIALPTILISLIFPLAASSELAASDAKLLKALSFARFGSDGVPIEVVDISQCVFRRVLSVGENAGEEVYYVNNIDPSRISISQWKENALAYSLGPGWRLDGQYWKVEIHGEGKIMETHWRHKDPKLNRDSVVSDEELIFYTNDRLRIKRSWKYIFSHGCIGHKISK